MSTVADSKGVMIGNHPAGLYVLFGAEMWERFSFYGMRALLVLYLTNHLEVSRESALQVYGTYTGLVYLTPLLGGYLADRYLGQRKAILIGGILMALGHFAMAFESLLYMALGLLILGNGFFKPNISTMVGQLYPQGDARRDSAYTIFYMGINLGAFVSPLVCGYLGERVDWHYGFGLAGIGMVLGLLNFAFFQNYLGQGGHTPNRQYVGRPRLTGLDWLEVALISAIGTGGVALALLPISFVTNAFPVSTLANLTLLTIWISMAIIFGILTGFISKIFGSKTNGHPIEEAKTGDVANMVAEGRGQAEAPGADADDQYADNPYKAPESNLQEVPESEVGPIKEGQEEEDPKAPFTSAQWQRMAVIVILSIFSIVFWAGFEQSGGTLNLFADNKTDRFVAGLEIPATWYQSINPLLILMLAPLFSMLWTTLDRTRFKINSAAKFGFGLILLGLGMGVMYIAESYATETNKAGPQWLVFVYFMFTVGELCLSPIGLSLVNKLAPARVASLMMALWFGFTAFANYLAANLERYIGEGQALWSFLFAFSIIPGVILLAINPLLKKMAHGRI